MDQLLNVVPSPAYPSLPSLGDCGESLDELAARLERAVLDAPANDSLRETMTRLAAVRLTQGRPEDAERVARQLVAVDPSDRQARGLLGVALGERGEPREAIRYLAFAPELPAFLIAKALAQLAVGWLEDAEASARRASELAPDDPEPFRVLGAALAGQRRYAEALGALGQALALDPDHAEAHLARAHVRLSLGDFSAWPETEWRLKTPGADSDLPTTGPAWDGVPRPGLSLLVLAEPSDADTVLFARYIPELSRRGVRITLACRPSLARLLSTVEGVDGVVSGNGSPDESSATVDAHARLASLPGLIAAAPDTLPHAPYLAAEPERSALRAAELERVPGLKVAAHWRSSPDDRRSFPLAALKPLADLDGVSLVSLQSGPGADEITEAGVPIVDLWASLSARDGGGDFADLAAALAAVDLLVTNDGPLAHLAGALGVPAWVALPVGPEWVWAGDGDTSPWYPSLRLFRQRRAEDWSDVFAEMDMALRFELASRIAARAGLAG